jgi:competence protein ComFC
MKMWLARYKYRGDERLAGLLARMLLHGYHQLMETNELKLAGLDLITFVPLNEERLTDRGFNQAERLARLVGGMKGVPVMPILARVRNTSKQSFKSRSERLEDLKGVFQVESDVLARFPFRESPLRIVIIDDVYTTGSTLQQCALAITGQMEAKVYGLSWAR